MSRYKFHVEPFALTAVAIPLHDGTNGPDYENYQMGFVIQAEGDTHLGDETVTDSSNALTIPEGKAVNILGFLSRGTHESYDLSKLYYVGGPFKLIIERKTI